MVSVLLIAFLVQLFMHLLNTIGAKTLNELLWTLYTKLPTPQSQDASSLANLRREVVHLNREMKAISAQDDFAKWARLRREHDKAKDKYDKQSASLNSFRTTFDRVVSALRWLGTQGLNFFLNMYFTKQAMFWLPQGWVPYPVEWVLSFPRAPLGAISINMWGIACASVIGMVSEAVKASWALKEESGKVKMMEKAVVGGGTGGGVKKEL